MWPIVGHEWAVELLSRGVETQRLSHAYLFVGPAQVGKRTLAKTFAQAILCTAPNAPCGECRSCQLGQRDRHPDIQIIAPDGDRIKIEAIRDMQHSIALSPVEGRYRICMITEFDKATTSAANALLKTLEEPPSTVILLLTASGVETLLPTIVSRCQIIPLRLLSVQQITVALRAQGVDDERARLLGHLSQGRVGWAMLAARNGQVLEQRKQILENIATLAQSSYKERFSWVERLSKRPERVPQVLQILAGWWRDVLLVASASTAPITNVDQETTLQEWANRYDIQTARRALQAIRDTTWRLEHNANLRLALEVLMLDLPRGASARE